MTPSPLWAGAFRPFYFVGALYAPLLVVARLGAFSGAAKMTIGKIETANRGTLMLDEIGDLPLQLQAKLLRFSTEARMKAVFSICAGLVKKPRNAPSSLHSRAVMAIS